MVHPHYQELLTAYVDGELSARQRRLVARLLRRSGEARHLLRQLQEDARQLRTLPAHPIPTDLSGAIPDIIRQRRLQPIRRPRVTPPAAPTFPAWTGWAAAAAVLLTVGLGSFLHYSRNPEGSGNGQVKNQGRPDVGVPSLPEEKHVAKAGPGRGKKDHQPDPPNTRAGVPEVKEPEKTPEKEPDDSAPPKKPAVKDPDEAVLASGQKESSRRFERVELDLPAFFKLHDLNQAAGRGLSDKLGVDRAVRIELPAKDAARAFDRIRTAFAARKLGMVIDPSAQVRLEKPGWGTSFGLFLENVTAREVIDLLARIGEADRKPAADKKSLDLRFDGSLVVKEMSRWDLQQLTDLLGVDPVRVRPQPVSRTPRIDIRKPLPEQTEAEVAAALEGKGVPRPGAARSAPTALVMALSVGRLRSPEVKRFLDSRKPAVPGTLQVFLVVRNLGS
jgi:hypothetical protein